jgi:hypothetical protein
MTTYFVICLFFFLGILGRQIYTGRIHLFGEDIHDHVEAGMAFSVASLCAILWPLWLVFVPTFWVGSRVVLMAIQYRREHQITLKIERSKDYDRDGHSGFRGGEPWAR